ncbi:LuxR C-terminal-related transcriptional regulator [Streptomyces sp. NPDC059982]|uniref:LuxR C-terminal-related transcriptional regulator n=1 Tax=unclassified Streptomyces TaxID=2593676 RepID=UPI00367FF787
MSQVQVCTNRDNMCGREQQLCTGALALYAECVRTGDSNPETLPACLVELGLLQRLPGSSERVAAIRPSAALARLVRPLEDEIRLNSQRVAELHSVLDPIQDLYQVHAEDGAGSVTRLKGLQAINAALDEATAGSREEILTAQPGGGRAPSTLAIAVERGRGPLERGVRMRTLYQHTVRHNQPTLVYMEQMMEIGHVEIRTLDELFDRLMIFDRKVAFVPARNDRQEALEIREPALVDYLAGVFETAWDRASPLAEPSVTETRDGDSLPEIQRTIGRLLVEGHMDAAIARRLGMSVRTCRAHIARLSAELDSKNRTQLGFLLSTSRAFNSQD